MQPPQKLKLTNESPEKAQAAFFVVNFFETILAEAGLPQLFRPISSWLFDSDLKSVGESAGQV